MENNETEETKTEEVKVRKKPGPKPNKATEAEENENNKNSEIPDYDYVIKVLDEAKNKIERRKEKEGKKEDLRSNSNPVTFIVPSLFFIVLAIQFVMLFTT